MIPTLKNIYAENINNFYSFLSKNRISKQNSSYTWDCGIIKIVIFGVVLLKTTYLLLFLHCMIMAIHSESTLKLLYLIKLSSKLRWLIEGANYTKMVEVWSLVVKPHFLYLACALNI